MKNQKALEKKHKVNVMLMTSRFLNAKTDKQKRVAVLLACYDCVAMNVEMELKDFVSVKASLEFRAFRQQVIAIMKGRVELYK